MHKTKEQISYNMQQVKSKDSFPSMLLIKYYNETYLYCQVKLPNKLLTLSVVWQSQSSLVRSAAIVV